MIVGVLQQRPAGVLEAPCGQQLAGVAQVVPIDAADLVQSAVGERHDVVGVDADDRLWGVLAGAFGVAGTHVQADRLKLGWVRPDPDYRRRIFGVGVGVVVRRGAGGRRLGVGRIKAGIQVGEERVGDGRAAADGAPNDLAGTMIGRQREEVMPAAPRDLVDPDIEEVLKPRAAELISADTLDHPPDGLPVNAQQPGDRRLISLGRKPRHEIVKVARQAGAVARERHALDVHAVFRAAHLTQPGSDLQAPDAEIQVPPDRVVILRALAGHRRERAQRANQPPATQRDPHTDPIGPELDAADAYPSRRNRRHNALVTRMGTTSGSQD